MPVDFSPRVTDKCATLFFAFFAAPLRKEDGHVAVTPRSRPRRRRGSSESVTLVPVTRPDSSAPPKAVPGVHRRVFSRRRSTTAGSLIVPFHGERPPRRRRDQHQAAGEGGYDTSSSSEAPGCRPGRSLRQGLRVQCLPDMGRCPSAGSSMELRRFTLKQRQTFITE